MFLQYGNVSNKTLESCLVPSLILDGLNVWTSQADRISVTTPLVLRLDLA